MLKEVQIQTWGQSPEWVDQLVMAYTPVMIANRALVILAAAVCLMIVCRRFRIAEPSAQPENSSWLKLSADSEVIYYDPPILQPDHTASDLRSVGVEKTAAKAPAVPSVISANAGLRANLAKLAAAVGIEFRLLRSERSLVVITPLAVFLPALELAFYRVVPEVSYSATYATGTARTLLFFLIGMTVFYVVESMQRDREVRIEPVLWSKPAPNSVLLLSKFLATFLLMLSVMTIAGLTAIAIQLVRGHAPLEIYPYLITYTVILIPSIVFMAGVSILLNVLLREKYLAYVVIVGVGAGLFYLYGQGYNHWLYNPTLYGLWTYSDLSGAGSGRILTQRIYWLALACLCLALAHLGFRRKSAKGFTINGRLGSASWALVITLLSLMVAVVTGVMIK
jgi:ABC-type transport system involved in multi-copper enzyme maturation permease subunit